LSVLHGHARRRRPRSRRPAPRRRRLDAARRVARALGRPRPAPGHVLSGPGSVPGTGTCPFRTWPPFLAPWLGALAPGHVHSGPVSVPGTGTCPFRTWLRAPHRRLEVAAEDDVLADRLEAELAVDRAHRGVLLRVRRRHARHAARCGRA